RSCIRLERIEMPPLGDGNGFAGTVAAYDLDATRPTFAPRGEPEVLHLDPPPSAEDAQHIVLFQRDGAGHFGYEAAREAKNGGSPFIDAAFAQMGRSHNRVGLAEGPPLNRPRDQPCHRDGIAADVENTATGQMIGIEPMFGVEARHSKAETRLDHAHLANRAVTYERDELRRLRVLAVH